MKQFVGKIGGGTMLHYLHENGSAICGTGTVSTHTKNGSRLNGEHYNDRTPTCSKCLLHHNAVEGIELPMVGTTLQLDEALEDNKYGYVHVTAVNEVARLVTVQDVWGDVWSDFATRFHPVGDGVPRIVWTWHEVNGSETNSYDVFWLVGSTPEIDNSSYHGYVTYRIPSSLRGDLRTLRNLKRGFLECM